MKTIVFTDLDGTLIDHYNYSIRQSKKAVQSLLDKKIPIIFCSSKTFAEQIFLQKKLHIKLPFIIENGSAIAIPNQYFSKEIKGLQKITKDYSLLILSKIDSASIEKAFETIEHSIGEQLYGYSKSADAFIAAATGLAGQAVRRARKRLFTETLLSSPPSPIALKILNDLGMTASQGGRFLTLQDASVDKGSAVQNLIQLYENEWETPIFSVGIGDSPNDLPMLRVVKKAFLVQGVTGSWADIDLPNLTKLEAVGPTGFVLMAAKLN